jgi:hypothetical protein
MLTRQRTASAAVLAITHMLRAADPWAYARHHGVSTGDPKKLDSADISDVY